ncbi:hypothetical protein Tco_0715065 [Tanacetum coccineum]
MYEPESEKESRGDSKDEDEDKDDENNFADISDESDDDNDGNNGNDGDDDNANDGDKQEGDDTNDDDEETDNDEVTKELYEDVNVNLGNEDTEMTNADQGAKNQQYVSQQSGFEQVEEDAHLLNLENLSPADNKIASLMETLARHAMSVPENTSIDCYMDNKLREAINKAILAHSLDYRQEAQDEKNAYIELVDTSMRALIKEEVNTQLPQILPQAVLDFAYPVIQKNVTESVEVAVLTRSSSQLTSTYKAAASLSDFELTKILIDKMEKNKSYDKAEYKKKLYDALVESYNTDKNLFDSYGEVFSLKRSRDDSDKDRDPSAGSDRGKKRRKLSKDTESYRDSRSKEKKSSGTSKDASQSQHKSSEKFSHAEEQSHIIEDSGMQQDQEFVTGDNDEQPADKEVTKADSQVAYAEEPPTSFDELNDTSFDFSTFVINWLKILNLTQEIMVGPVCNLLKGTCKCIMELEYHLEECSKATTERLDWHNPENKPYPFDLRKPLPLIQDHRGRQIIPEDYFINKDLEYLKGGDLIRRYSTSVTKIKAVTYELKWIEDLVPELWSPVQLKYDQHAYLGTSH